MKFSIQNSEILEDVLFDQWHWSTAAAHHTSHTLVAILLISTSGGNFFQGLVFWPMVKQGGRARHMSATLLISMGALQGGRSDQWSTEADAGHTPSIEGAHATQHARRGGLKLFDHWVGHHVHVLAESIALNSPIKKLGYHCIFILNCGFSLANLAFSW